MYASAVDELIRSPNETLAARVRNSVVFPEVKNSLIREVESAHTSNYNGWCHIVRLLADARQELDNGERQAFARALQHVLQTADANSAYIALEALGELGDPYPTEKVGDVYDRWGRTPEGAERPLGVLLNCTRDSAFNSEVLFQALRSEQMTVRLAPPTIDPEIAALYAVFGLAAFDLEDELTPARWQLQTTVAEYVAPTADQSSNNDDGDMVRTPQAHPAPPIGDFLDLALRITGAGVAYVHFVEPGHPEFGRRVVRPRPTESDTMGYRLRFGDGLSGRAAETGKVCLSEGLLLADPELPKTGALENEPVALVSLPVWLDGRCIATVNFASDRPRWVVPSALIRVFACYGSLAASIKAETAARNKEGYEAISSGLAYIGHTYNGHLGVIGDELETLIKIVPRDILLERFPLEEEDDTLPGELALDRIDLLGRELNKVLYWQGWDRDKEHQLTSLSAILAKAVTSANRAARQRDKAGRVRLDLLNDDVMLIADGDELDIALFCIMDNAVKYAFISKNDLAEGSHDPGATVSVKVFDSPGSYCLADGNYQGSAVAVAVRDFGPGISELDQLRIFEVFERTADAIKKSRGMGLGLFVAKQAALSHRGCIEVSSNRSGTTFELVLPLART